VMKPVNIHSVLKRLCISCSCLVLVTCAGGYQAPVTDQGERQVVQAPIIVDSLTPLRTSSRPVSVQPSVPSNSASVVGNAQMHRVRRGDTLYSIAFEYDLDFRSLAIANSMNPPYTIFVDQGINLDVSRITNLAISSSSKGAAALGTPVNNNSVARAQAGNINGGVLRQPIADTVVREPQWQWPHSGRVLRGFQANANKGIDISGSLGDPVLAAGNGEVVYSGNGVQGNGDLIIIRHNDRYLSAYSHNSVMLVIEGSRVNVGEKIGEVGSNSAGVTMLHFEIRVDGKPADPGRFLPHR